MKTLLTFLAICGVLFSIGFMTPTAYQQNGITVSKVTDNIYMLQGRGGNIGVCTGKDGVLMIDDKFANLAEQIKSAVASVHSGDIKYLINTHYHGDHTGGNEYFGKISTIVAHDNVRKRLQDPNARGGAKPEGAWPVITFNDAMTFHFNGEEIQVMHYPNGHTDGDAVIFFKTSNVVHMGDDFFVNRFPYVDLNAGGSVQGLTKNIESVISAISSETKIIPGHGPLATIEDLKKYHGMLAETSEMIAKSKQAGKTLEEIKSAGLPSKWESWGSGFINTERWIETVFNSLD